MLYIRDAVKNDYDKIISLMKNELGYPVLDESEAIKRLDCFRRSSDWATFIALINNEIVGFIGIMKAITYTVEGYYSRSWLWLYLEQHAAKVSGQHLFKKLKNGLFRME